MGFLRRLLGGNDRDEAPAELGEGRAATAGADVGPPLSADEAERAHELELARFEQARTDDLIRRQQRFADRSWTPPTQGGERRADDADAAET